jgi:hypothetical protein
MPNVRALGRFVGVSGMAAFLMGASVGAIARSDDRHVFSAAPVDDHVIAESIRWLFDVTSAARCQ